MTLKDYTTRSLLEEISSRLNSSEIDEASPEQLADLTQKDLRRITANCYRKAGLAHDLPAWEKGTKFYAGGIGPKIPCNCGYPAFKAAYLYAENELYIQLSELLRPFDELSLGFRMLDDGCCGQFAWSINRKV